MLPLPGDQRGRATCLAWAMTAAHEFTVSDGPFSIEYLHWISGKYPGGRGTVLAASGALRTDGQPEESQWQYLACNDDFHPDYLPPATVVGPFLKADIKMSGFDIDTLINDLSAGRMPVVGLRVTDAFLRATGGFVGIDGPGVDGHAVTAVGVARYVGRPGHGVVEPGDRLVCIRNSWGRGWGVDGYALMSEAALSDCGVGAFVVRPPAIALTP